MNTYSDHHDGIDRMVDGVDVVRRSVRDIRLTRFLPAAILTGAVTDHAPRDTHHSQRG